MYMMYTDYNESTLAILRLIATASSRVSSVWQITCWLGIQPMAAPMIKCMTFFSRNFGRNLTRKTSSMASVFVSKVNPVTGKVDWVVEPENFDFHQEIARSAYADMLHDTERNKMYDIGLQLAIRSMHDRGLKAHVLDIGTGTGLLSMMAVRAGADSVTACEAFMPMAECASKVIAANNLDSKISLIRKISKDITVGPNGDMPHRANILVTEVFDTELIGEGGVSTFDHAHRELLEDDCIVVPSAANMYAQPVTSSFLQNFHAFHDVEIHNFGSAKSSHHGITLKHPMDCYECTGSPAVHDLQLSQLRKDQFTPLTNPVRIFRFNYSAGSKQVFRHKISLPLTADRDGECHAILMWWDLEMDTDAEVILSCAPYWAHPESDDMQWRDHWMQAVYYPSKVLKFTKKETFYLTGNHDEYSLWFDVSNKGKVEDLISEIERPVCTCGGHVIYSHSRLHQLNDTDKNQTFAAHLAKMVTTDATYLSISDGSYLSIIAAKLGAKKVYAVEPHPLSKRHIKSVAEENGVSVEVLNSIEEVKDFKIDVLFAEPFYHSSHLPWHNLHFWYAKEALIEKGLSEDVKIFPDKAKLFILPMEFKDLWKIRAPVGDCEGFDISEFDKMIEEASDLVDAFMEPQPLWEYPGKSLSGVIEVITFDLRSRIPEENVVSGGKIEIVRNGTLNGVTAWMDFYCGSDVTCRTGLVAPPSDDGNVVWDPDHRQAVHIVKKPTKMETGKCISYQVTFHPKDGNIQFKFDW